MFGPIGKFFNRRHREGLLVRTLTEMTEADELTWAEHGPNKNHYAAKVGRYEVSVLDRSLFVYVGYKRLAHLFEPPHIRKLLKAVKRLVPVEGKPTQESVVEGVLSAIEGGTNESH